MQLAGGRIGEAQFQLGVLLYTDRAPASVHAAFQVLTVAEGGVLEARARQGRTGLDAAVEARVDHEQIVVAGLGIDMPGFALDQIPQHIVRHSRAETAEAFTGGVHGLIEHQRHRVVEA